MFSAYFNDYKIKFISDVYNRGKMCYYIVTSNAKEKRQ